VGNPVHLGCSLCVCAYAWLKRMRLSTQPLVAIVEAGQKRWFACSTGLFCFGVPPGIDLILSGCYKTRACNSCFCAL
jgi:hypothetical protein